VPAPDVRAAITSAPVSAELIAINVVVFTAVGVGARLLDVLALPPSWAGVSEQPWTLLTAFFTSEAGHGVTGPAAGLVGSRRRAGSGRLPGW
jgi:hypothetical protein